MEETLALCSQKIRRIHIEHRVALFVQTRATQHSHILLNLISNAYDSVVNLEKPGIALTVTSDGIADVHHRTLVYDDADSICRFRLNIPLLQTKSK